ncbi:Integrator complex subunit 11 like [Actinidia chinensis var. chinensis]|uniref:Integrator complex subunit 11 like n=1 Tax=Actinidia chinensis var. chinensis TaxID=1590841 RepID=A0A2R6RR86_ACTCC|nr:Integrator complex subunit 11 like [Actinidia chinensis var. chinensis]
MAVSLNSVSVVHSPLQGKYLHVPRSCIGVSLHRASELASPLGIVRLRRSAKDNKRGTCLLVADGDRVAIDASETGSGNAEIADSGDQSSSPTLPSSETPIINSQLQTSAETVPGPQNPVDVNGSVVSSNLKSGLKRSPLTAREKLRAARVLSRYTESKASTKPDLGSKVLEALRESDRGKKKSGLPEAPTNLFDDSKRGMPKAGWTFEFPGGVDVFIIAFSFVFISTLMFATTYLVWKVGAIHFNEY